MTGADGGYVFTSLPAGTYNVRVTDRFGILAGYTPTAYPVDQTADNNNKLQPYTVILPTDTSVNMTADFGYILPGAAIGDYVWYDANGDGLQDVTEPGLGNVTLASPTPAACVVATTTTDANGGYIFTDLPAGTYTVTVTDLNGVLTGYLPSPRPRVQDQTPSPVTLTTGQIYRDADFGYVQPAAPGTPSSATPSGGTPTTTACATPASCGIEGIDRPADQPDHRPGHLDHRH